MLTPILKFLTTPLLTLIAVMLLLKMLNYLQWGVMFWITITPRLANWVQTSSPAGQRSSKAPVRPQRLMRVLRSIGSNPDFLLLNSAI